MPGWVRRDTVVGWAFFGVGAFLIHRHDLAIDDLLHARAYSLALFPHHLAAQYYFMGYFILALLLAAGLCFVTAWGVGHRRTWSRWTGLMPCLYLLLGFPYLTAVGALGLYFLWKQPTVKRRPLTGAEFWNSRRQSGWMLAASVLGWFVARAALNSLEIRAYGAGLPLSDAADPNLLIFLLLLWGHVALHECGHALAAVWVGFRVKALAVGPLVFSKDPRGRHVRFDWRGLLLRGGYTGFVPDSPRRFLLRETIVIAAGPFTSLLAGGVLFGASFLLPGTAIENLWPLVMLSAIIGFYLGVLNLLPLGYSDGTMLFHLLLRTRRGEELTALVLRGANLSAPGQPAREYEDDVAERQTALRQVLDSAAPDRVQLGRQYIGLGWLEVAAQHRRDAELHLTQGLALLSEAAPPVHEASEVSAWECLHILRTARHDDPGAAEAYRKGLAAACRLREEARDPAPRLEASLSIAGLHARAQAWDLALEETEAALAVCPGSEDSLMRKGMLLHFRAQALLETGRLQDGLEPADQAAAIFRAQTDGVAGPHHLGTLGQTLWNAGRLEAAISMITECIRLLEARGAFRLSAAFRISLAEVLRSDGRVARAACVLPPPERIASHLRSQYLERRGAIRRSGGKLREAIEDLSAVVAIAEQETGETALPGARARLADALAEAGEVERAEQLARQAHDALAPTGHPDLTVACIALAVIGWRKDGSPGGYVEAAVRRWNEATSLLPAEKARALEAAAKSLDSAGIAVAAAECRAAAQRHRERLVAAGAEEALAVSGAR
jgi:tetratricopeptide (TPR) repeat protein